MAGSGLTEGVSKRLVELHFQPLWRYVDGIREFCGFFTQTTFDDQEVGARIGMVVHELVENAIRYSAPGPDASLDLTVHARGKEIDVTVENRADAAQVERLREAFAVVMAGEPRAVYAEAMRRARTLPEDESGLGLPRIRFEGRMDLALETEPDRVRVIARGSL